MPRRMAPLLTSIWDDPDFCARTPGAQRLYMQILSQKRLTLCGVVPLQIRNWARGCDQITVDDIERDLAELEEHNYVLIDRDTEELMVRTILKHDTPKGQRTVAGMWNAWREIDSEWLRREVVHRVEAETWATEGVTPPDEAKALRNAPSDTPSDGACQSRFSTENETGAVTCHLSPVGSHLSPSPGHQSSSTPPASASEPTSPSGSDPAESTTTEPDERFEVVVGVIVDEDIKEHGAPNRANPDAYRATCVNNLLAQQGATIRRWLDKHPDAPADMAVRAIRQEMKR